MQTKSTPQSGVESGGSTLHPSLSLSVLHIWLKRWAPLQSPILDILPPCFKICVFNISFNRTPYSSLCVLSKSLWGSWFVCAVTILLKCNLEEPLPNGVKGSIWLWLILVLFGVGNENNAQPVSICKVGCRSWARLSKTHLLCMSVEYWWRYRSLQLPTHLKHTQAIWTSSFKWQHTPKFYQLLKIGYNATHIAIAHETEKVS